MKNLAPFFSFLILLVTSCSVEPADISSERNQSQNFSPTATEPTFMSADVNEVPYSNLKPLTYFDITSAQTSVETYHITPLISYNYLLLQGSDVTLNSAVQASSIIINIRIPESQWAVGTYELKDQEITGFNGVDSCASLVEIGTVKKTKSISGTLTITEFDIVNRVIKGTFSFSYLRQNGAITEGPYQLNNGAFKYKLDAPHFNQ